MSSSSLPHKLHLGCFDCPVDGWLNTDITPHLWIARVPFAAKVLHRLGKMDDARFVQHRSGVFRKIHFLNLAKPFPYPAGHFDFVFSSHVFEHIPRPVLKNTLGEILRVLKVGGTMRVVVPDLSWFVGHYSPERADEFVKGVFEMDNGLEKNRHQWMYSSNTLIALLESIGFQDVHKCVFRQGDCPDLDKLDNRPDHSLFVEGSKAG